jgi:non-ribosomal peptide synthetase component E (peptide arylation enzyme)
MGTSFCLVNWFFETESCYIAQASLKHNLPASSPVLVGTFFKTKMVLQNTGESVVF